MAFDFWICPHCGEFKTTSMKPCNNSVCKKYGYHTVPEEFFTSLKENDPFIGKVFYDYLIVKKLGSGGFGSVYLGLQKIEGIPENEFTTRALKFIKKSDVPESAVIRELKSLVKLNHENIINLISYKNHEDFFILITEYLDGFVSLRELIEHYRKIGSRISFEIIKKISEKIFQALNYCHKKNIIHRDIKPENILVKLEDDYPQVKLIDFGISKTIQKTLDRFQSTAIGSPYYIAPEQFEKAQIGNYTDIYSLTLVLFELLTLKRIPDDKRLYFGNPALHQEESVDVGSIFSGTVFEKLPESQRFFLQILKKGLITNYHKRYQNVNFLKKDFNKLIDTIKNEIYKLNKQPRSTLTNLSPQKDESHKSYNRSYHPQKGRTKKLPPTTEEKYWKMGRIVVIVASIISIAVLSVLILTAISNINTIKTVNQSVNTPEATKSKKYAKKSSSLMITALQEEKFKTPEKIKAKEPKDPDLPSKSPSETKKMPTKKAPQVNFAKYVNHKQKKSTTSKNAYHFKKKDYDFNSYFFKHTLGMKYVKGGCMGYGVKRWCVKDFYLQKWNVRVQDFEKFVKETGYTTTAEKSGYCWIQGRKKLEKGKNLTFEYPGFPQRKDDPVVCLSVIDMLAYINWLNKKYDYNLRLLSTKEYNIAVSRMNFSTPAGNICDSYCPFQTHKEPVYSDGYPYTSPNCVFPEVITKDGICDLVGNVWETTLQDNSLSNIVFKGGSYLWPWNFIVQHNIVVAEIRSKIRDTTAMTNFTGFRLAHDAD